ncbi:MAG TPA: hypothetical protein VK578_15305 [Edaphobacter sp.]|nr:hypothetical protein [Edaphobacter sp.]
MTFLFCLVGVWTVLSGTAGVAQNGATPEDEPIKTLHVYTNLLQVPTVVVGPHGEQIKKPIEEKRFSVSIDSGPWFRATHVRLEGDDPISLSILLDVGWGCCGVDAEDWGCDRGACAVIAASEGPGFDLRSGLFSGAVLE